jgi:hypothetical protein
MGISCPGSGSPQLKRLSDSRGEAKSSYLASTVSNRLFKFLMVGALGVVVNLLVMALLIQAGYLRDWRASTIASAIAALHN